MNADSSRRHSEQMYGYGTQMRDVMDSWHVTRDHARLNSIHSFVPVIPPQDSAIDPGLRDDAILPPEQHSFMSMTGQDPQPLGPSESSSGTEGLVEPQGEQEQRLLPSRDVSDDTIDDAYVTFILYCNPAIPSEIDTSELRRQFRVPPKSDGKTFSIYTLFELIRKLEHKSLKTWAQLAIELGVEPPALEKGQSAQKVQQYAVRLKRWMHAMHVDAFFEYLLNKSHVYWTQIPQDNTPSEFGRDGVPAEEDLALRALLPETRPKRGRKKAEDRERDNDSEYGRSPAQRPRLHSPGSDEFGIGRSGLGDGMTPMTSHPHQPNGSNPLGTWNGDGSMNYLDHPLINIQETGAADWGTYSAYPPSAITPRSANPFLPYDEDPRSAMSPSKPRTRRRHGPTVSSAWPSSGSSSGTKLRGRPPSNRSVSDGPFSTFPANPNAKAGPTINLREQTPISNPLIANTSQSMEGEFKRPAPYTDPMTGKPRGLHLQVPERAGGNVRLATPPPSVAMSNGIDPSRPMGSDFDAKSEYLNSSRPTPDFQSIPNTHTPLTNSSLATPPSSLDQLQDDLVEQPEDRTNLDAIEVGFIHCILFAQWYDTEGKAIPRCSLHDAARITKQLISDLRSEASSKEAFLINLSALAGGRTLTKNLAIRKLEVDAQQMVIRITWTLKYGALEGNVNVKIALKAEEEAESDGGGPIGRNPTGPVKDKAEAEVWKQRYLDLYAQVQERNNKVSTLRKNVLESLIATKDRGI